MTAARIIKAALLIAFVFGASTPLFATAPEAGRDGKKSTSSTIWVKVDGEGFINHGNFRVAHGATLLSLVKEAKISPLSNGRFFVARTVEGRVVRFDFRLDKTKEPALPDFTLSDGDFVYGAVNGPCF